MRRKITNETWEQIKTGYAAGINLREIARKMNIPEGTVLAHAKRHGWTQQKAAEHKDKLGIAGKVKDLADVHKTLWPDQQETKPILNLAVLTGEYQPHRIPPIDETGEYLIEPQES
jgi:hypothetical protein